MTQILFLLLALQATEPGPPPGKLVDIGGRRMHLHCTGAGSPTVVLEAGASAFAIDFSLVQPEIAKTNRVCSYDRAGSGWSEKGPLETPEGIVSDLHALLEGAAEKGPYVLVGASMGGIYVRLYQLRYPAAVAGMVLIDPAHEGRLFVGIEGKPVAIAALTAEEYRTTFPSAPVKVPRRAPQTGPPFDRLPRELYETRIKLDRLAIEAVPETVPADVVAKVLEGRRAGWAKLREAGLRGERPLGDRPLVILTRGEASQELRDVHASLLKLSGNAQHRVVDGAGHEIHLFDPPAVIAAIRKVVSEVRSPGASGPR